MREKLLIANWKMNFSVKNSIKIFEEMNKNLLQIDLPNDHLKIIICKGNLFQVGNANYQLLNIQM